MIHDVFQLILKSAVEGTSLKKTNDCIRDLLMLRSILKLSNPNSSRSGSEDHGGGQGGNVKVKLSL
jgi:hypothetical protein